MKKTILIIIAVFITVMGFGQKSDSMFLIGTAVSTYRMSLSYSPKISFTENKKQDSIINIFIEGDTLSAIRQLLVYCLQEKSENDNARILLSHLNLDYVSSLIKDREFTFYLKSYKRVVSENKRFRDKHIQKYCLY
jgi:hypothetical protein